MFLIGASLLPGRVRRDDRRGVTVSEPFERGRVTQRPVDPFGTVQSGELNSFGHLHFHP